MEYVTETYRRCLKITVFADNLDAFTATLENETLGRLVLILLQSVLSWAILFLITIGILIGNPQRLLFV